MPDAPYITATDAPVIDDRLAPFAAEKIERQVSVFEGIVEREFGVAYTPRSAVATFDQGWPTCRLPLPNTRIRSVTSVTVGGVLVAPATYTVNLAAGIITCAGGWSAGPIVVAYVHGWDEPPAVLIEACCEYVLSVLKYKSSGTNRNTIAQGGEGSATRYSTPDRNAGRWTGWLEVDRLLGHLVDERIPVA